MSTAGETMMAALASETLTRHLGRPTPNAIKIVQKEIAKIYAATKTTHANFELGNRFGFAAAVLTRRQFVAAFNTVCEPANEKDPSDWEFNIPERPLPADPNLGACTNAGERKVLESKWRYYIVQWEKFEAQETVLRQNLRRPSIAVILIPYTTTPGVHPRLRQRNARPPAWAMFRTD